MKKIMALFVLLFTVVAFAQESAEVVLDTSFNALYQFLIPAVGAAGLSLWLDTVKHYKNGTWDFNVFLKTKLLPFIVTVAVAIGVYYMMAYAEWLLPFAEGLAGVDLLEVTAVGIFGFAARIVEDVIFKKPKPATDAAS